MKKRNFGYLCLLAAFYASAAPISPEQALQRVEQEGLLPVATRSTGKPQLKMTMKDSRGDAAVYVFTQNDNHGYMIVSADDSTIPMLGYSEAGSINSDNMAPGLEYWLGEYSRQIEYARANDIPTRSSAEGVTLPAWSPIAPKIKTNWDQSEPYNDNCPMDGQSRSLTGCVATAMSQVMKYHNYPAKGKGSITYTPSTLRKQLSLDFSSITFNWANMIDSYLNGFTAEQADAVATLMQAAGYSVQMNYSGQLSGAVSNLIPGALINYFNYDEGIRYYFRDFFPYSEWCKMIYDNINTYGPVIYDGNGAMGGHCFIVDGYDGNGYFHINWGWSGLSDGYFILDALNPEGIGAGGGSGGFNYNQDVILNIKPAGSGSQIQNEFIMTGSLVGSINGSSLSLDLTSVNYAGWRYIGIDKFTAEIGLGYVRADNPNGTLKYVGCGKNATITPDLYIPPTSVPAFNLNNFDMDTDVDYRFIVCYRTPGAEWTICTPEVGFFNYFTVTKTSTRYKISNESPLEFSGSSLSLQSKLYAGNSVTVNGTIVNNNSTELTRTMTLALLTTDAKPKVAFIGTDDFVISISAGKSVSETWNTGLQKQNGIANITSDTEFYLALYDPLTKTICYQSPSTVTMKPNPGDPAIVLRKVVVDGAPESNGVFEVNNAAAFSITTTLQITSGYFSYPFLTGIYEPSPTNPNQFSMTSVFPYGVTYIEAGETKDITVPISLTNAVVGNIYGIMPIVMMNGYMSPLAMSLPAIFEVTGIGGVEEITDLSGDILFFHDRAGRSLTVTGGEAGLQSVAAYSLNGTRLSLQADYFNGNAVIDLNNLGKGIVIVTAIDSKGNTKSIKLAL